jgi:type 1 fimbria pilin
MKYAILLLGLLVAVSAAETDGLREFRGEIADSSCALNVHSLSRSHKEMLKAKYLGTSEADCARYCVRHLGSSFVLVSNHDVYRLELHQDAEQFAGKKVVVKGKLDKQTNTITVSSIQ